MVSMMKLKNNISLDGIIKSFEEKYGRRYTENQLTQLRLGYEHNVNILVYAHPNFSSFEMQEIRLGLENNVDVTRYAYWNFDCLQMQEIRLGLESGIDVSTYARPDFPASLMEDSRERLERQRLNKQSHIY